jgi:hypothetical protein
LKSENENQASDCVIIEYYEKSPKIPSCLLAIFGVKTRDFEEKSLKTGNFAFSLYFAEYYQFL